ncbi:polyprenol dehydrogenase-like isoform X1 [Haemaphysalis longicornis]
MWSQLEGLDCQAMTWIITCGAFFVMDMVWLYVVSAQYLLWECYLRVKAYFTLRDRLSYGPMQGKTVVITGGLGGIGHETMRVLLSLGARVIDGSPVTKLHEERKQMLLQGNPEAQVRFLQLDLSSMASVKSFAVNILESETEVDILICNAAVMLVPYQETKDGFESHMSINYLGHCLLTALLLPRLIAAGSSGQSARIVNVSSCAHKAASINVDDLNNRRMYSCYRGYAQSKLAQVLFTMTLGKRMHAEGLPVTVTAIHPGIVNTHLYQRVWWAPLVAGLLFKTPAESAETVLHAALSHELKSVSGCYLEERALARPHSLCNDCAIQEGLWQNTWTLLKPWLGEQGGSVEHSTLLFHTCTG